jgi:hypothetical protein
MADYERAMREYPSTQMSTDELVSRMEADPLITWRILHDIFDFTLIEREKEAGKRRLGRRPMRVGTREEILAVAIPKAFTNKPFPDALRELIRGRSQDAFARRMGCAQGTVSKLLNGHLKPDRFYMERAAAAGEVEPWYFAEYRAQYLAEAMAELLMSKPQMSVTYLQKLGVCA